MSTATSPKSSNLTRRTFLRSSAVTATALSYNRVAARATGTEASDTLRVALAGCGSTGMRALVPSLRRIEGVKIQAVCDIWEYKLRSSQRILDPQKKEGILAYLDYNEMLEKAGKDIDVVIIATPCWMHAPQTRKALEAGKHVYCEKMMSNAVEPARDMVRAQRQTGKLLQIGHQRRSNPRYLHLRDKIIRERKLLGRITHLYGQWHRSVKPPWIPKMSPKEVPAILAAGYANLFEYANWRWFKKYGGGPISDLGSHQIDAFNMLLGVPPLSVMAAGGTDFYRDREYEPGKKLTYEHLDNAMVVYEYDMPGHGLVRAHYQVLTTSGYQGYHEKVHGTEATALISEVDFIDGLPIEIYRERDTTEGKRDTWEDALRQGILSKTTHPTDPRDRWAVDPPAFNFPPLPKELDEKPPHQHHLENFIDTIRRGGKQSDLACPVEEAFRTCVAVLAVNDAVREQKRIELTAAEYTVA